MRRLRRWLFWHDRAEHAYQRARNRAYRRVIAPRDLWWEAYEAWDDMQDMRMGRKPAGSHAFGVRWAE